MNLVIVVSDQYEAKQILKFYKNENIYIFALSLEAEYFLKKNTTGYKNPLYNFISKNAYDSGIKYFSKNFEIARTWYKDPCYEYVQDRFGYFLFDLERSLDFADKVIRQLHPIKIITAKPKSSKGYFIEKTLIQNAFLIQARINNIRTSFINSKPLIDSLIQTLGKLLKPLIQQTISYKTEEFDILFITPPLKFLDLGNLVKTFASSNIRVAYLTYSLTIENQRKLNKLKVPYFLKESFVDGELKDKTVKVLENILKAREWKVFNHKKYPKNGTINNFIRSKIKDVVENELLESLIDEQLSKKIFDTLRPKALLTLTDPDPKCLPYINEAKRLGIKTIAIEHGGDFDLIPYSLPKSDKYITWSRLARKRLIANNYTNFSKALESNRILIGQSPFHSRERISGRKSDQKINVLFLTTINYFEIGLNFYYSRKLFKSLEKAELNIELLIRLHPFQDPKNFRVFLKEFQLNSEFVNNISLKEAVNISDVVIFENTTATFDALLSGKPTVFFNPYTGGDFYQLEKRGATLTILSESEIENKLIPFLKDKHTWGKYRSGGRKFAIEYLGLDRKRGTGDIIKGLINVKE